MKNLLIDVGWLSKGYSKGVPQTYVHEVALLLSRNCTNTHNYTPTA